MKKISAEELAQRLRGTKQEQDKRFAFFLGAGCSVKPGIPVAGNLVKDNWLPRLRDFRAKDRKDLEVWIKEEFPQYDSDNPAASYGDVIAALFLTPDDRQREIERLCDGKFPGFGYAVLASLIAQEEGRFNVVLTTNFDDLVSDALYLFTKKRPLVVQHELLASYIRPTRTRPLVVKIHGDHRLTPYNTASETERICQSLETAVSDLLHDRGIVFMGYSGSDVGICELLNKLPANALPSGVFWVNGQEPQGKIREWLYKRKACWIEKTDFDEMMLLVHKAFELEHPKNPFDAVFADYYNTYKQLSDKINKMPASDPNASALKKAVEQTDETFKDWWSFDLAATRSEITDPEESDRIYKEGIAKFPNSHELLNNYALFLTNIREDHDAAEQCFKLAIEADPTHADILGNYALFLKNTRKDSKAAEHYFMLAREAKKNMR